MRTCTSLRRAIAALSLAGVMVLGSAGAVAAGARMRHSGSIVSVSGDGHSFVLAEVGPWQVRAGKTVMTYHTITVTPDTQYVVVARAYHGPGSMEGDFVELPLGSDGIYFDDYITVDCRHEATRLVALKITVIELPVAETAIGMRQ